MHLPPARAPEKFAADAVMRQTDIAKMKETEQTIKNLLKDGTPDWVRFPNDYKNMAKEDFFQQKEISDNKAVGYQLPHHKSLTDFKSRLIHPMRTEDFLHRIQSTGATIKGTAGLMPGTIGLWACSKHTGELVFICSMDVRPVIFEWSVIQTDTHGNMVKELRGWRTVLWRLIQEGILTEQKAHEVFGAPNICPASETYRKSLYYLRNGYFQ